MIRSVRNRGLRLFTEKGDASRLSVQNHDRLRRIIAALEAAKKPGDLNIPGFDFHRLKGTQKERYSVSASGNWRVTFAWSGEDAIEIDLEDYH
jgi:proteic killer suppression protein